MGRNEDAPPPVARRFPAILLPSLGDCLFLSLLAGLYAAGGSSFEYFLFDGDTGWHIRTGDYILDQGRIPRTDPFSFSREGAQWFAWEWLAGLILAAMHRALELKGVVLLSAALAALYGFLMLRGCLLREAGMIWAILATTLGLGAASVHFLARPHLFTLAMLAVTLQLVIQARAGGGRAVWWLVPLTVLWANVHPGFVAGVAILLLTAAGESLEAWAGVRSGPDRWRSPARYLAVAGACLAASLMNPYGLELHRHIVAYLSAPWIRQSVAEFASPQFRSLGTSGFEILLFSGLIVSGRLLARRDFVAPLWILLWAHQALASARHIPIFVLVAAPFIAEETTRLFDRIPSALSARMNRAAADLKPGFQRLSLWSLAAALIMAAPAGLLDWPVSFPAARFPAATTGRHADLLRESRIFTTDEWADYLIYRLYPDGPKVFMDGRSDFYGPEIMHAYETLLLGRPGWDRLIEKYRFDAALLPPGAALASLLRQDSRWRVVDESPQAILLVETQ